MMNAVNLPRHLQVFVPTLRSVHNLPLKHLRATRPEEHEVLKHRPPRMTRKLLKLMRPLNKRPLVVRQSDHSLSTAKVR